MFIQIIFISSLSQAETRSLIQVLPISGLNGSGLGLEGSNMLTEVDSNSKNTTTATDPKTDTNKTPKNYYGTLNARVKKQSSAQGLLMAVDAEAHLGINNPLLSDFTLHELYARGDTDDFSEDPLILGRKLDSWNRLDESFALGRIQPIYNPNPLHPVEQGLTGLLYQMNLNKNNRVSLFGSLVYMPNQGGRTEIKNEQFEEGHPWVALPPKTILFNGVEVPIHYNLDKPDTSNVVFQNSLGISYEYSGVKNSSKDSGLIFKTSLFRKPDNQMVLGYAGTFNLEKDAVDVQIKPAVAYHKIAGVDLYYQYYTFQYGISLMSESNDEAKYDSEWTYQTFKPTHYVSPAITWQSGARKAEIRYLHVTGGEMEEAGLRSKANPIDANKSGFKVLPTRNLYSQAIKSSIQWPFYFLTRTRTQVSLTYTHEIQDNGDVIGFEQGFYFRSRFKVYFGGDLIASSPKKSDDFESIATRYQYNDRAYLGMSYVF